jgi:hypothetical protein
MRHSDIGACLAMLGLVGSCMVSHNPLCAPEKLAEIEARYIEEVVSVCAGQQLDSCHQWPAIRAKYDRQREAWASCR